MDDALKSKNLYRIGIAIHAFADTFSHQNFLGYNDNLNAQKGLGSKIIPNIGHADFGHEPDKIHNRWYDSRLAKKFRKIDNDERFLEAAREIFIRLYKFKNPRTSDQQAISKYEELNIEDQLRDSMDESYFWGGSEKARRKAYKKIFSELNLAKYAYDPNAWRYAAIEKRDFKIDIFDKYWAKKNFHDSDWYKFQKAVEDHKELALAKFHPLYLKAGFAVYQ